MNGVRRRDHRGLASLELAIITPVMLLVIFGVIQASLWFHARNAAESAAAACAEGARGLGTGVAEGTSAAYSVAEQSGALHGVQVGVTAGTEQVTCTVSGYGTTLIGGGFGMITTSVSMPKDRITQP